MVVVGFFFKRILIREVEMWMGLNLIYSLQGKVFNSYNNFMNLQGLDGEMDAD